MGNTRDWRESFSQLELAKANGRKRTGGKQASVAPERVEAVFPPDIVIPPPGGTSAIPLIPAMLEAAEAEAGLILREPEPAAKPRKAAKRKPAAKRARKPAARKTAAPKKPARKPAARKARPKASASASARREAATEKLAAALAVKLAETPAIPLPDLSTPLARTTAAPVAPLPRKASLAHYRKGGLIEAIGFWLRSAGRRFKAKLGASKALAETAKPVSPERQIEELKAENERLRRQLDALLALSDAAQFKFQS